MTDDRAQQGARRVQRDHEDAAVNGRHARRARARPGACWPASPRASGRWSSSAVVGARRRRVVALSRIAAQPSWTPAVQQPGRAATQRDRRPAERRRASQYKLTDGGSTMLVPEGTGLRPAGHPRRRRACRPATSGGCSLLDQQGITTHGVPAERRLPARPRGRARQDAQAMTGVQTAIVHLAIPKKDVFTDHGRRADRVGAARAAAGHHPAQGQVRSVMHMVAGSVPGLNPSDVTVTDAAGTLLSTREDDRRAPRAPRARPTTRPRRSSRTGWAPRCSRCSTRCSAPATPSSG